MVFVYAANTYLDYAKRRFVEKTYTYRMKAFQEKKIVNILDKVKRQLLSK